MQKKSRGNIMKCITKKTRKFNFCNFSENQRTLIFSTHISFHFGIIDSTVSKRNSRYLIHTLLIRINYYAKRINQVVIYCTLDRYLTFDEFDLMQQKFGNS